MQFLTKGTVRTPIKVPERLSFELGGVGARVTVTNWEVATAASLIHQGLYVDIEQEADAPDESLNSGVASADHVMTLIAFAASAGVGPIELVATIDAGPGRKDRFIRQSIELPSEVLSTRLLSKETFDALWHAFHQTSNEQQQRLARMLHWFRKGALDEYSIDKFIDAWTALEVLNPLIKKKHDLPDEEVMRTCDRCGEPVVTGANQCRHQVDDCRCERWFRLEGRKPKTTEAHSWTCAYRCCCLWYRLRHLRPLRRSKRRNARSD
jgi:hypothetical protein